MSLVASMYLSMSSNSFFGVTTGVNLRGADVRVTEHLAHRLDGHAVFKGDEGRERVPSHVVGERPFNPRHDLQT